MTTAGNYNQFQGGRQLIPHRSLLWRRGLPIATYPTESVVAMFAPLSRVRVSAYDGSMIDVKP
jgi:hypothetical protein